MSARPSYGGRLSLLRTMSNNYADTMARTCFILRTTRENARTKHQVHPFIVVGAPRSHSLQLENDQKHEEDSSANSSMTLGAIGKGRWALPVVAAISRIPRYLRVRAAISPSYILSFSSSASGLLPEAAYQKMRHESGSRWTLVGVYERPSQKLQSYDAQEACQSQSRALFLSAFPFAMTSRLAFPPRGEMTSFSPQTMRRPLGTRMTAEGKGRFDQTTMDSISRKHRVYCVSSGTQVITPTTLATLSSSALPYD
ncbi:hypothetical protein C8F01DRAFT_1254751 [Mycena amicta]|nr:hypothetical protein C8F01DRAFT_1254751 [Mycena amicta]